MQETCVVIDNYEFDVEYNVEALDETEQGYPGCHIELIIQEVRLQDIPPGYEDKIREKLEKQVYDEAIEQQKEKIQKRYEERQEHIQDSWRWSLR